VYLFLPLAHALALIVQFLVLDVGATLAYWEKDPQKIVANLMELKPTFFPSVPRIFEKIHTLATTAGDTRELEQATRVGMAVRQAQHRGEEVPADLQAAFERAEQALYANVRNLLRVGCERSPRRPNPAGGAASRRLSASLARTSCPHHWRAGLAQRRHGARLAPTRLPSAPRWRSTIARA
jgi:hypothetical protein